MKIIFITREGYNLPGARVRCYNFARELARHNIETEILSYSDTLGAKDGEAESQMGLKDKLKFSWRAFNRLTKEKESIFCIQRFNYHSLAPYLAHLLKGNRIILDLDDWELRENPRYYLGFYPSSKAHYLTKIIARRSIFCIAASRFLEKFLSEFNNKVCYIPSGVDTELFRPSFNKTNNTDVVFCWIGTLHKKEYIENINYALECFNVIRKKYTHIYFDIFGDGIYRKELMCLLDFFNDPHIRFKGWIAPDKIPAYLDTADIGLMPVVSNTKFNLAKSPTKLFEYMAMAKSTLSSNIGECSQVIRDGHNGLLADTKPEFTEKMSQLVLDAGLRRQLGDNARKSVEESYSLEVLGRRLSEIISDQHS